MDRQSVLGAQICAPVETTVVRELWGCLEYPSPDLIGSLVACLPWGLLIVDQALRIIRATPLATTLLSLQAGVRTLENTLIIERACVHRALSELVRTTAASLNQPFQAATDIISIPDRQGKTRFAARVFQYDPARSYVLIVIMDLMGCVHVGRARVAAAFGLSEREAEFAELFSQGLRVQQIAAHMGVTVNTARVHLRNVLMKTACSSQIQLARIFATLTYLGGMPG